MILLASSLAGGEGSAPQVAPLQLRSAMQMGQWEFVLAPAGTAQAVYVEANLAGSDGEVVSTVFNTALFHFGGPRDQFCANWTTENHVTPGGFAGTLSSPGSSPGINQVTYRAKLSADGRALTRGSYSARGTSLCAWTRYPSTKGAFGGYRVAPLNGIFRGTLTGGGPGVDEISIQVTQDSDFGITASGTSRRHGVITRLSISPAGSPSDFTDGYRNVIGATISAHGIAERGSESTAFELFGHFDRTAARLEITYTGVSGAETGILRRR